MRTAAQWLDDYGDSHRHHANKALHWICVPVIAWCVLGLLWSLPFPGGVRALHPEANWASFAVLAALFYYALLSVRLALGALLLLLAMLWSIGLIDRSSAVPRVGHLRFLVRGRVDRPIRRPRHRRQATLLLQGHPVPDDRAAVAAGRCVSAAGNSLLGEDRPVVLRSNATDSRNTCACSCAVRARVAA